MSNSDLPVGDPENFLGEINQMDLSELKDESNQFMVAAATGDPRGPKSLVSMLRGPYNFYEMVQEVANMWEENQLHAKVYYCEKDRKKPLRWLDECTIDYIEARYEDILTDGFLTGSLLDEAEYDCRAGVVSQDDYDELVKKEEEACGQDLEQDSSP